MSGVETASTDETAHRRSPEDQVFQAYVSLVSHLEFARSSTVEYTDDGACIWTVIDAAPDADVTFRLVNQREYAPDTLSQLISSG